MSWFSAARTRLTLLFARRTSESRINDELAFHIVSETQRLVREEGLSPEEARRRTIAMFGGITQHAESLREGRGLAWIGGMSLDTESVRTLLRESAFPHPVGELRLIETHISWVVLTGRYAYKLKKPVDYGFLDFSTPELRKHYCEEELRLNRRFAPELYLDLVPVRSLGGVLHVGEARGKLVDYAVRMRQFDDSALLSRELDEGRFGEADALQLGHWLAALHRGLPPREAPRVLSSRSPR